ncbi:hypothetical protein [Paenibacillus sp. JJ-223]|uniref:hypothetical protein n=1 Tax=Paenibacillus sp. JJ-223 TaxID=2905647 RepID=UPI001F37FC69|nr:hypothetical protein [Paenibacillus sp. JJ-223]
MADFDLPFVSKKLTIIIKLTVTLIQYIQERSRSTWSAAVLINGQFSLVIEKIFKIVLDMGYDVSESLFVIIGGFIMNIVFTNDSDYECIKGRDRHISENLISAKIKGREI